MAQWTQVNSGLGDTSITVLSYSGSKIYAGTKDNGVFVSTNNGTNWSAINNGLSDKKIRSIANFNNNLFVGTSNGLFKSINNGNSWTLLNLNAATHDQFNDIVSVGNRIIIGTNNYGIFYSNDDGITWVQTSSLSYASKLKVFGNTIFASEFLGELYLSKDSGINWSQVNLTLPIVQDFVTSIASHDTLFFAGTFYGNIYYSSDTGLTWTLANNGLMLPTWITCFESTGTDIFLGTFATNSGVYLSSNLGGNWIKVNNGLINKDIECLTLFGGFLFAGTYKAGVWRRPLSEMLIGINELKQHYDFTISPNPSNTKIQFTFNKPFNSATNISIYSIYGEVVLKKKLTELYKNEIDITNLTNGIYYLSFDNNQTKITKKFIKI